MKSSHLCVRIGSCIRFVRGLAVVFGLSLGGVSSAQTITPVDIVGHLNSFDYQNYINPNGSFWGNEPVVAVNPTNPNLITISSFTVFSTPGASLWYSTNGGGTWNIRFPISTDPAPGFTAPFDQSYSYDSSGTLHGVLLSGDNAANTNFNVYHGSTTNPNNDGTNGRPASNWTWTPAPINSVGASPNIDQPWLKISGNNVYAAYDNFAGPGSAVEERVAKSTDGGVTFPAANDLVVGNSAPNDTNPGFRLAVDGTGNVYAIWGVGVNVSGSPGVQTVTYHLNRYTGGNSWNYTSNVTADGAGGLIIDSGKSTQNDDGTGTTLFGGKNDLRGNITTVAVDSTGSNVYAIYGKQDGTGTDRMWAADFTPTGPGGNLVERPNPVAFSVAGERSALPSAAVLANGTLGVLYDTSPSTDVFNIHFATSTDQGLTFVDQMIYSFNSSAFPLPSPYNTGSDPVFRLLGDYQFLLAVGDVFYGAFPGVGNVFGGGVNTTNMIVPFMFVAGGSTTSQYWNGGHTTANNVVNGGSGIWDYTTTNWTNAGGTSSSVFTSGVAIFSGPSGGTVTLGTTIFLTGLQFSTNGYVINPGAGFTLNPIGSINITVDPSVTATINAPINGTGSITKAGTGALLLAGDNGYGGTTTVNAGSLAINGDSSATIGAVIVNAGATLSGHGSIGGVVTVNSGGHLEPGFGGTGTFTVGGLALNAGAFLDYHLGQVGTVGGPLNELLVVNGGGLALNGTLNVTVTQGGAFTGGVYRLITYTGGENTPVNLGVGTVPAGSDLYVQWSIFGQVNLVNKAGLGPMHFWDGPTGSNFNNGVVNGGSGTWILEVPNDFWTDMNGTGNVPWNNGDFAVFQGTPGTVTVNNGLGNVTFSGAQFFVDGYTVDGNALTASSATTTINVGDGTAAGAGYTATIKAVISGNTTLQKQGLGTLVLSGANTYVGSTAILGGTLQISADNNLGDPSNGISFDNGAVLQFAAPLTITRDITLGSNGGGGIDTNGHIVSLSGTITGGGGLTKIGAGELKLSNTDDYSGVTTVNGGTLVLQGSGSLNSAAHIVVNGGGIMEFRTSTSAQSATIENDYNATLLVGGVTNFKNDSSAASAHITNNKGGTTNFADNSKAASAQITNNSSGSVVFTGNSSGTNATTVNNNAGGAIDLSGLTVASLTLGQVQGAGDIHLGSKELIVGGQNADAAISGMVTDGGLSGGSGGKLTKQGTGNLLLSGANSFTGGATVNAGRVQTQNASALGNGPATLSGGVLQLLSPLNVSSFTWNGGNLDLPLGHSAPLAVAHNLTNGGGVQTFVFDYDHAPLQQLYPLISFGGTTNFVPANFAVQNVSIIPNVTLGYAFVVTASEVQFEILSATATGAILQNSAPVLIPTFADFYVKGPVTTGTPTESNTIKSLTFSPGSSLQIFNNLTVTSGNFTVDDGSANITGGSISTPQDFNKQGLGALNVFSNAVVGGNLNVQRGSLAVGGSFNVNGQAVLSGGGKLYINPGAFFSANGPVNVNSGSMLDVNGTLKSPLTHILHGGTLQGSGVILGDVRNSGLVAPGNSPGTLTIKGNYTQTSGGTLQIQIASTSNFDHLVVSGHAKLSGTLDVQSLGAKLAYGDQFAFLQAGSISGKFNRIEVPDPSVNRGRFFAEGGEGILLIAPASYTLVVQTPNQTRVAKALDHWIGIEDGDIGTVTLALDMLTAPQYPGAFQQIMPTYYESALNMSTELTHSQLQSLHFQLSSRKLGAEAVAAQASAAPTTNASGKDAKLVAPEVTQTDGLSWNTWTEASGLFSQAGVSLSPARGFESGSFIAGADYSITRSLSVGLFTGYQIAYADHDSALSKLDLGKFVFGGYASYERGGFYTHAAVGGGASDYEVRRAIVLPTLQRVATSKPDGGEVYAEWGGGYDMHLGRWTVGPNWSVQYDHQTLHGFTETGADSLNLRLRNGSSDSLRTYLGARAACTFKVGGDCALIPELRASWQHEFMQNGGTLSSALDGGAGPSFDYLMGNPGRDSLDAGVALGLQIGSRFYASLFYNAEFGRTPAPNHTVGISANWRF